MSTGQLEVLFQSSGQRSTEEIESSATAEKAKVNERNEGGLEQH